MLRFCNYYLHNIKTHTFLKVHLKSDFGISWAFSINYQADFSGCLCCVNITKGLSASAPLLMLSSKRSDMYMCFLRLLFCGKQYMYEIIKKKNQSPLEFVILTSAALKTFTGTHCYSGILGVQCKRSLRFLFSGQCSVLFDNFFT